MRVQILSDIHIELWGNPTPRLPRRRRRRPRRQSRPVRTDCIGAVMRTWRYPDLRYVIDNRERYGSETDAARLERTGQCRDHGVELRDPGVVDIEDVRFVGETCGRRPTTTTSTPTGR